MKTIAQLTLSLLTAAWSLAAVAAEAPDVDDPAAASRPRSMVVVLKYNADYGLFAGQAQDDRRALAAPQAWQYLDKGVWGAVQALEAAHQFEARHVYSHALKGFAAHLTPAQMEALRNDPAVERVEPDLPVSINAQTLPWGIRHIGSPLSSTRAGDGTGTVTGVHVFVIDTGIEGAATTPRRDLTLFGHVNFTGDGANADCNGHGTHVAGTIGAQDNDVDVVGAAPGVPVIGVKVLNCWGGGTYADVIKGVDWVTAVSLKPAVANLSLGGAAFAPLDDAVRRSAAAGVFYTIAAGNNGRDACDFSPARAGKGMSNGIVTVGATDSADREAIFSNHGECVDLWAPGVSILSLWRANTLATLTGTSMAAPHVAGTAALMLSRNPSLSPDTVELILKATARFPGTTSRDGRTIALVNARFF